jgi:hypothetical protein
MSASSPLPNAVFVMVEIPPPYIAVFIWKVPTCRAETTDRHTAFYRPYPGMFVFDGMNETSPME